MLYRNHTTSYLAGASLNAGVGAAHILAQPLGAATGISHSEAIAILLSNVVEVNHEYAVERYARIARALDPGITALPDLDAAEACAVLLRRLCGDVGISDTLSKHGIDRSRFPDVLDIVARSTSHIRTNPRPVDDGLLCEILERCL